MNYSSSIIDGNQQLLVSRFRTRKDQLKIIGATKYKLQGSKIFCSILNANETYPIIDRIIPNSSAHRFCTWIIQKARKCIEII